MLRLHTLPYEVLANIISNINFDDVFNLAVTSKDFSFLIKEGSMCKSILQAKIPFSSECLAATSVGRGYARGLRRAAKRRNALTTVSPYTVATIGFCDAYIYCKGMLCYILDNVVRILDLHNSGDHEIVISIPRLLNQALSSLPDTGRGGFQILYYSDSIVSCLYRCLWPDSDSASWLIVFSVRDQCLLLAEQLDSIDNIFVRNNEEFLYYGTHSEVDADGHRTWLIHGCDLKTQKWFPDKIHLSNMAGSEINSTVCFEIYKGHFYALSNQTSFEVEEIDWTSFYHCARFPLDSPSKELLEKTENKDMWRRQHQEGPLDERWMSLALYVDEADGELRILESRKEWYLGSSRSQRNYYITNIVWPENTDDDLEMSASPDLPPTSSPTYATSSFGSSNRAPELGSTSTSFSEDFDNSSLPNCQLLRLRRKDNHPNYLEAPPRKPQNTHPGDDGSAKPMFTLAKTRLRAYHPSSSTFLDLVDDPLPSDWTCTQRLRLRAGSRRLGPPLRDENTGFLRPPSENLHTALDELYRTEDINFWPAAQNPSPESKDEQLDEVYRLLNPPTHLGNVEGAVDERSLVYVTGLTKPQALIFVGFDAAIRLRGVNRWRGLARDRAGGEPHIDGRATGLGTSKEDDGVGLDSKPSHSRSYVDVEEKVRAITMDRKGKGVGTLDDDPQVCLSAAEAIVDLRECPDAKVRNLEADTRRGPKSWIWTEVAMYRDIGLGLNFGLDPWGNRDEG